ncbi:MAG: F0F1 ATP synthase subunit gamma [Desulfobacterales bacterium]|nr:F0F1 ATP synthase subunit gamma [Desulfobacterales bacterium]
MDIQHLQRPWPGGLAIRTQCGYWAWQALLRPLAVGPVRTAGPAVCVVVGSDQGMCGQFNEAILSRALADAGREALCFWAIGDRVRAGLADAGRPAEAFLPLPGTLEGVGGTVQELVRRLAALQPAAAVIPVFVVHHRLQKGEAFAPLRQKLLPLDRSWVAAQRAAAWPGRCLPMLGLSREALFHHLFRQYLFVSLFRSLVQSMASENAARLRAMQAAEKNILELAQDLDREFSENSAKA